jgi:hypothetical protein
MPLKMSCVTIRKKQEENLEKIAKLKKADATKKDYGND